MTSSKDVNFLSFGLFYDLVLFSPDGVTLSRADPQACPIFKYVLLKSIFNNLLVYFIISSIQNQWYSFLMFNFNEKFPNYIQTVFIKKHIFFVSKVADKRLKNKSKKFCK